MNKGEIQQVDAVDIIKAITNYTKNKSIVEEVNDIKYKELNTDNNDKLLELILRQNELTVGSSQFKTKAFEGKESKIDLDKVKKTLGDIDQKQKSGQKPTNDENKIIDGLKNKKKMLIAKLLFFTFLSPTDIKSDKDMIEAIDSNDINKRIAKHLELSKDDLKIIFNSLSEISKAKIKKKIAKANILSSDENIQGVDKTLAALAEFNRFSDSEIVTPSEKCSEMVKMIPAQNLVESIKNGNKILDIASKQGEFAYALYHYLKEYFTDDNILKNAIYSIPTSKISYEFTRKMYENLGLNIDNIAEKFNSYDLLEKTQEKTINIITQNKKFSEITIDDIVNKGDKKVKFDVVVGNPPYQENISKTAGNKSLGKQLFPAFIELSIQISNRYTSLITPARWFTGDAQDKSFVKLRNFIKNNNHIKKIVFYKNENDIFNNVEIKGGIQYLLNEKTYHGEVEFIVYDDINNFQSSFRNLFEENYNVIISDINAFPILEKIRKHHFKSLTSITTGRNPFGVIGKEDVINKCSTDVYSENLCELRCKDNKIRWIDEKNIKNNKELFNKYKVFISKSSGSPKSDKKIIGMPYVGKEKSACTDSLFTIGKFDIIDEAENLSKYIKTKFLRYLVSILKSSHNVTQIVYEYVPLQDFTNHTKKEIEESNGNLIDWSKSISKLDEEANKKYECTTINEIDAQLYNKYGLEKEEVQFIEKIIKPMGE